MSRDPVPPRDGDEARSRYLAMIDPYAPTERQRARAEQRALDRLDEFLRDHGPTEVADAACARLARRRAEGR